MSVIAVSVAPTLTELAETANREHGLTIQAGSAVLEHAIRAGEALLAAKALVERGEWEGWLAENFQESASTARSYMRFARNQDELRRFQATTIHGARQLLAGISPSNVDAAEREEAAALYARGLNVAQVAKCLGRPKSTVYWWCNPRKAKRDLEKKRQFSHEARRARRQQEDAEAVRAAGGQLEEAYALIRRALQALGGAHGRSVNPEAREHMARAMRNAGRSQTEIAEAARLATALTQHLSAAMEQSYRAEDEVVRASRTSTSGGPRAIA